MQNEWDPIKVFKIPADLQNFNLDRGEKESIALALSKNALLLMDEERVVILPGKTTCLCVAHWVF